MIPPDSVRLTVLWSSYKNFVVELNISTNFRGNNEGSNNISRKNYISLMFR